jgi:hypothetical protein
MSKTHSGFGTSKRVITVVLYNLLVLSLVVSSARSQCLSTMDLEKKITRNFSFGPAGTMFTGPSTAAFRSYSVPHKTLVHVRGCLDPLPLEAPRVCITEPCPPGSTCVQGICVSICDCLPLPPLCSSGPCPPDYECRQIKVGNTIQDVCICTRTTPLPCQPTQSCVSGYCTPPLPSIPVVIEVRNPEHVTVASITTWALAGVKVPFEFFAPPYFISDLGCPGTWRVRISTLNSRVPAVTVSGEVTFSFAPPGTLPNLLPATYPLDLPGIFGYDVRGNSHSRAEELSGHLPIAGYPDSTLVRGTEGRFQMIAGWGTSTVSACDSPFELLQADVDLLQGDSIRAGMRGFSLPNSNNAHQPAVFFDYVVTPADAQQTDPWLLRVTNNNADTDCYGFTIQHNISDFNIEGAYGNSTFTPACSETIGTFGFTQNGTARQIFRSNFVGLSFTWSVPDSRTWRDLRFLQLRIRKAGRAVKRPFARTKARKVDHATPSIVWLRFDENSGELSLRDEGSGEFSRGLPVGSKQPLTTSLATLDLANSSVVNSGPNGTDITLNLTLSFGPSVTKGSYVVEVAAEDDLGTISEFQEADTLTIGTRSRSALNRVRR